MEALETIVVRRVVDPADAGACRAPSLVGRVRALVRDARAVQPELAAYRLHDVGIKWHAGRMMVSLYFHR